MRSYYKGDKMNEMKEFFLRCSCHDPRCLVWFWFVREGNFVDMGINLNSGDVGLWKRIKNSFLYIFAQKRFWYYGDISLILDEEKKVEINKLIEFLKEAVGDRDKK